MGLFGLDFLPPWLTYQWIAGTLSACLNATLSMIFFIYCFYKIIMDTCGLGNLIKKIKQSRLDSKMIKESKSNKKTPNKSQYSSMDNNTRKVRGFRTNRKRLSFLNQSMRFLIYLQIVSFGLCIDKIIGIFSNQSRIFCVIQSLCLHIFATEMHMWSLIISIYLFFTALILPHSQKDNRAIHLIFEILSHICVHSVTAALVSLPHIFDVVGESSGWCWIDTRRPNGNIIVFASFFGPVWIIMILTSICYSIVLFWVIKSIKNTKTLSLYLKNEKQLKLTIKLILYPAISVLVWLIPTINRILGIFSIQFLPIQTLHFFFINMNGFFNVIVFFMNPLRHLKLLFMIFCCPIYICMKSKPKNQNRNSITNFGEQTVWEKVEYLARHGDEYEDDISTFTEDFKISLVDNMFDSEDEFSSDEESPKISKSRGMSASNLELNEYSESFEIEKDKTL